jgi:hypothetical protein
VVLAKDEVAVYALGKTPGRVAGVLQEKGAAMAVIPAGVLIRTE